MSAVTGWAGTVKAVAWSFLGLRGKHAMERDVQQLKPLQVIAVGLLGVFFRGRPGSPGPLDRARLMEWSRPSF